MYAHVYYADHLFTFNFVEKNQSGHTGIVKR